MRTEQSVRVQGEGRLIAKLIHAVDEVITCDARVHDALCVVFVPDFSVKSWQRIHPAADLPEQVSTTNKQASDTGNMQFTMNGALTIDTLDGANVGIRRVVGAENFFRFGQTVEQVEQTWRTGHRPRGPVLARRRELFRPLVDDLLEHDPFLVCADFQDCADDQARVDAAWRERDRWTRVAILNVARCGRFSSDRAVRQYDDDIWSPPAAAVAAAAP